MRKQSKILSLLLALSLLLVVFFVLPASAEDDFMSDTMETEIPHADLDRSVAGIVIDNEIDGNVYSQFTSGLKLNKNALNVYLVQEIETAKDYIKVVSPTNGIVDDYFTTHVLQYDTTDSAKLSGAEGYFVYEFDIACDESVMANMEILPVLKKGSIDNRDSTFCTPISLSSILTGNENSWVHVTIVGRMRDGKQFVYANNALIAEGGFSTDANDDWWFIGCRFDLESAITAKNEGYLLDNISCRIFETDEAADNIDDTKDTLADWSENIYDAQKNSPKLPALATVDGTPVYSSGALLAAINGTETAKNVEILRNFTSELVITASAVVETHGLNAPLTAGAGTTVTTEGTVLTFKSEWKPSTTEEELPHNEDNIPTHLLIDNSIEGNVYIGENGFKIQGDSSNNLKVHKVTDNETGNTYLKLTPTATGTTVGTPSFSTAIFEHGDDTTTLTKGTGNGAWVYEFDLATDSSVLSSLVIKPFFTGGKYIDNANDGINWSDIVNGAKEEGTEIADNRWVHITIVCQMSNGEVLVYVDNGRAVKGKYFGTIYGGTPYKFAGCLFELPEGSALSEDESLFLDNFSLRIFKTDADTGTGLLEKTWTIEDWDKSGYNGEVKKLPAIAKVGDEKVYSLADLNALLAEGDDVNVHFLRSFAGTAVTARGGEFHTHGNGQVTCNNAPTTVGGKVVSGSLAVSTEDDVVTFTKITEENLTTYTVATRWVIDAANRIFEEIYFLEGDKISYIGNTTLKTNYIEDGKLYNAYWADRLGAEIVDFGTAVKGQNYQFILAYNTTDTDITIKNELKYNLSLYANFDVNLYVPADKTTLTGETVTIGGAEYVVVTKLVSAPAVADAVVFEVSYTVDDVEYTEKVTVNVVDYAVAVLDSEYSDKVKRVMITALEYANEVYKLLNGAASDAITAVLDNPAYAAYHVEANTEYGTTDNSALNGVISGANLELGSEVKIVLNVASGFSGTVTVNYNDYLGVAQPEQVFEVVGGDVIELNVKIYNLVSDFVITTDSVSGSYSLGAYVKGLIDQGVDADFAQVLFTYAKTAEAYKLALDAAE